MTATLVLIVALTLTGGVLAGFLLALWYVDWIGGHDYQGSHREGT